jgi:uncharacterized membrane protein HdeD (DUF308 family)
MTESESEHQGGGNPLVFWIALTRGLIIIFLGLSLLVIPDKTLKMLGNFMGIFWVMTGIVSIRQESRRDGNRLSLAVGVIGVLAGLLVVTRTLAQRWLDGALIVSTLGVVIALTGIAHVVGGFRVGKRALHGRTSLSIMLGIFEFVLGVLVLLSPTLEPQFMYWAAIAWAILGGILLLGDAYRQRREMTSAG